MHEQRNLLVITIFLFLASLVVLVFLMWWGVQKPQNATPSKAAEADPTKCQGNPSASAKCFDCKKDTGTDQVNVLDFTCFRKFYGQSVGKP